ncbi:FAD-dependent oxidoreductase [Aciduricibacillus chroicocephali]|uniref:FAD-dependent oxidoreductase n=1 Tax=Aciduricibacillus chroicocephali TaxID=3054939 RepID=A0ABY9KYQ2_9BACI|nr:FAD-dependent oxidoreductase [Bacillaceae bacterium 44XB]
MSTRHESIWNGTVEQPSFKPLKEDIEADIVVAGGGIAGITTAFLLSQEGKNVVLLEARTLLSGTSGYTTAKLSAQHYLIYAKLIELYGENIAKLYYEANCNAISSIESWAEARGIDCDFLREDSYVFTKQQEMKSSLEKEAEAYKKLCIDGDVIEGSPAFSDAVASPVMRNQAMFHPGKWLKGLIHEMENAGVRIFENTSLEDVEKTDDKIVCKTGTEHNITCSDLVIATHFPVYAENKFYVNNMSAESSVAMAFKTDKQLPTGMYITAEMPKWTMRNVKVGEESYILVGGESHPTGDGMSEEERYNRTALYAEEHLGLTKPAFRWSTRDYFSPDHIPLVGHLHEDTDHIYVLTGFSKWGLSNSTAGAQIIKDLIMGNDNPYIALYSPQREREEWTASSGENEAVKTYGANKTIENLKNNQAAVIKKDDKDIGVFKDENGELHYIDLSCTHMGCGVKWNDGDLTWDCPCHASRFSATGEVIGGPATEPLEKIDHL